MQEFLIFCVCIIATTIGSISGVGGGVIIKPAMDAISGLPTATISFMSGCTVLAMSITNVLRSHGGSAKVNTKQVTPLALGAAVGGILGKELFSMLNGRSGGIVVIIQQSMMILLTVGAFIYALKKHRIKTCKIESTVVSCLIGFALGVISTFLGIGGGPFNLVVLSYFFSMDTKTAALNSLYIILFSQSASLLATILGGSIPKFSVLMLILMAIGGISGGFIGRSLSKQMDTRAVDRLYFCLLIFIIALSAYNLAHALTV